MIVPSNFEIFLGELFDADANMKNSITPDSDMKFTRLPPSLLSYSKISTQVSEGFSHIIDSSWSAEWPVIYGIPEYSPVYEYSACGNKSTANILYGSDSAVVWSKNLSDLSGRPNIWLEAT